LTFACTAAAHQFPQPCKHPGENAREKKKKEEKHHTTPHPGREETFFPHTNRGVMSKMQAEKKSSLHTLTKQSSGKCKQRGLRLEGYSLRHLEKKTKTKKKQMAVAKLRQPNISGQTQHQEHSLESQTSTKSSSRPSTRTTRADRYSQVPQDQPFFV
jgi:hypothetical protein